MIFFIIYFVSQEFCKNYEIIIQYFPSGTCGINWCVAFGCSDNGEPDPRVKEIIPKQEFCNVAHIFGKINGNDTLNFSFNGNGI